MNIKKLLGKRISKLRKAKGLTQEQFAEKIGLQISSISYIETGKNFPLPETLEKIVECLEVRAEDLFKFNEDISEEELCSLLNKSVNLIKNDKEKLKLLYEFSRTLV